MAKAISVDYRLVHSAITSLAQEKIIRCHKVGQSVLCSVNHTFNSDIFLAELSRRDDVLTNKSMHVVCKQIREEISSPFFVLLLFGSHASGKAQKGSDIDLMLIADNESITRKLDSILSLIPLDIHLVDFSTEEFLSMLRTTKFNVGQEAFDNNVILFGIEDYYRLIKDVR